jgi:L-fuconolactonase
MIIDAHTHLFAPDTERYPFAPGTYRPTTDGSVELLRAQMDGAGVERAFTISPWVYGWEAGYTLDALAQHRDWLAAGVLVDPRSAAGPARLERLVREHGVSGLRIQGRMWKLGPLDDPDATPLWAKAADLDLTVDVNATLDEYPQVARRAAQFPRLRLVLDHCGYVLPELSPQEPNLASVVALARFPNVYAKLTFLGAASRQPYPFADVHWMAREIVDAFGAERCLFGTNFPKAQFDPAFTYRQTVALFAEALPLSAEERAWVLGGTAARLWRWG